MCQTLSVKLVINPDAHSANGLADTRFGVDFARRGWLEKEDVFNTLTLAQVTKELEKRKKWFFPSFQALVPKLCLGTQESKLRFE